MTFAWFLVAAAYLGFIFWLGTWGDGHSRRAKRYSSHPYTYSFALAIYCTAWTYFGAVGEAVRNHWNYLPILLGPILLYLFGYRLLRKLIYVSKKQHITTIADLISSRYGKRQIVALVVTLIVLLATIPYIALQLQAIGAAFSLVSGAQNSGLVVFSATLFIGVFCIFFGTRRTDVTEYRHGLMLSIAFESLLKLVALALVALVAWWVIAHEPADVSPHFFSQASIQDSFGSWSFWMQTFIAAAAVLCLPRQFHVAIIDNLDIKHVATARWLFPLYLAAIALLIPVIASAGMVSLADTGMAPDNYVVALSQQGGLALQALVFIGGLSAATAMIIVSTLTLSTMLSNDVILPKLLSQNRELGNKQSHILFILWLRRGVIAGILLLAFAYHIFLSGNMSLASIGLLAFSLVIQLLPAIIGGLYWQKAHAHGVIAGLVAGIFAWVLFLVLPLISTPGAAALDSSLISITATLALAVNLVFFIVFSRMATPNLMDKIQAHAFVTPKDVAADTSGIAITQAKSEDLVTVLKTFLGKERTQHLLTEFEKQRQHKVILAHSPSQDFILFCERSLGGVIGASSSNLLIQAVLQNQQMNFEQLVKVFDDTTQAIQNNQTMLFASLESLQQGISVIDKELRLVAWNKGYLDTFQYPDGMVSVGTPVEELVRFNAERGECGAGEVDQLVRKRMEHLKAGKPHKFVRQRSDGRVVEMVGNPLPNGGFVTSFNDVTDHIELQKALRDANIDLEKRVLRRTDEVKAINAELRKEIERRAEVEAQLVEAREIAEQANASKTRFLALASHDVLQPLNSAKLYLTALQEMPKSEELASTIDKLSNSVNASESMIATLLEIARLDQGALSPDMQPCHLPPLLQSLVTEFAPLAQSKNLKLRIVIKADAWCQTDPLYLHRIMRNLLSNAIKYCHQGGVLLALRKRQQGLLIQVFDTGEGIGEADQDKIFKDFYRAHEGSEPGVGLGLAVVTRLSKLLGLDIGLRSIKGRGSVFSLWLQPTQAVEPKTTSASAKQDIAKLHALCIDDDNNNLDAMQTLLNKWQIEASTCNHYQAALQQSQQCKPDILLVDYQLGKDENGLDLIAEIRESYPGLPAILITAVREQALLDAAKAQNVAYLSKPVKPAKLRSLLRACVGKS